LQKGLPDPEPEISCGTEGASGATALSWTVPVSCGPDHGPARRNGCGGGDELHPYGDLHASASLRENGRRRGRSIQGCTASWGGKKRRIRGAQSSNRHKSWRIAFAGERISWISSNLNTKLSGLRRYAKTQNIGSVEKLFGVFLHISRGYLSTIGMLLSSPQPLQVRPLPLGDGDGAIDPCRTVNIR